MRHAAIALLLLLGQAAAPTPASPTPEAKPAFEVATIKRNVSGQGGSVGIEPGGRFRAVNANVLFLIATMYRSPGGPRLFPSQIIGLPDWASDEKYDMTGKVSEQMAGQTAAVQFRNMAPMVQSLLEDRFKLALHHETREMPIYALVVTRPNVMKPTTTDCRKEPDKCRIESTPGHYSAVAMNVNNLLIFFSSNVERVVIDRTGLQGSYDINVDWAVDANSDKPSFFTAIQEQLGLKLDPDRGPVDVLVIDHLERPSED